MLASRSLGQIPASRKYDVLTALGAHACGGSRTAQKRALRLMTLITARYNWQRNELSTGRSEIARLWQVDERTVKREISRLKQSGWLIIKQPPARGRVTVYGLDWDRILSETRPAWDNIGPDFAARLGAEAPPPEERKVVAFPAAPSGDSEWQRAQVILQREDPAFFASWLANVTRVGAGQGILELAAPTPFHAQYLNTHGLERIRTCLARVAPQIHRVIVTAR